MPDRPALLYDGACSLCRRTADWVREHDRAGAIELLPFQDPACAHRFPALLSAECVRAVQFVSEAGRVSSGADAVREVLERLPGMRPLARLLRWPPLAALARAGYEVVARLRPRDRCSQTSG